MPDQTWGVSTKKDYGGVKVGRGEEEARGLVENQSGGVNNAV